MSMQKKAVPEQKLSGQKRCFACNETSHSLDQCSIKYKLVTVAHQFGYATKFPFIMIQPSEEMIEKETFYHHCVLITSNVSNLDTGMVKVELQKLWNLSGGWVLRRECSKSFLASFSSEGDVVSCLKNPNMEAFLNDEKVKLTATRWTEGDHDGSNDLVKQWFLVYGVPRKYRSWVELYQVASAFGVLIDVDEESFKVGDKEPISLKIALTNIDGAPFSYHYVVGWPSRMIMLTVEAKIDSETSSRNTRTINSAGNHVLDFGDSSDKDHRKELKATQSTLLEDPACIEQSRLHDGKTKENKITTPAATVNNSKKTTIESSKPEGVQSICLNSTRMIEEDHFKGISKPPIKHVYTRRSKKQQVTKEINKSSLNKLDKGMGPESSNAARIGASKMECKVELKMEEMTLMGVRRMSEEVGECREREDNSVILPTTTINSKEKKISKDSSKIETAQLVTTKHIKGVSMDYIGPGRVQFHVKQYTSKIGTQVPQNFEDNVSYESFSEMGLPENLLRGIYQYGLKTPSMVHQRGIVPLCKGLSVVHQSLFGTTVTLCCGVLHQLDYASEECQALILVPTYNSAQETKKVIEALGRFLGVKAHACTGGTSARTDRQILSSTVQVLIGTPGCILGMLQRHSLLRPDHIRMLVLDEADELLRGGSKDQIYTIIQHLPIKIQVGLFSTALSNEALETSRRFMDKPVIIIVPRDEELKDIRQYCLKVDNEEKKLSKFYALLKIVEVTKVIIFVNTKDKVISLTEEVGNHYTVSASHDGMDQRARDIAIQKFKSGLSTILIATDLRGTSTVQVPIVINYDMPTQLMQYIHRVQQQNGQQHGRRSVVINFATPGDERVLFDIQKFCNRQLMELPSNI